MSVKRIYSNQDSAIYVLEREEKVKYCFQANIDEISLNISVDNNLVIKQEKINEIDPIYEYLSIEMTNKDREEEIIEIILEKLIEFYKESGVSAVINNIKSLKRIFNPKNKILKEMEIKGLLGELLFLKDKIKIFGDEILSNWTGYEKEYNDFMFANHNVEVKTTTQIGDKQVQISSERQLELTTDKLYLVVYEFGKVKTKAINIPSLFEEIVSLLELGSSVDKFKSIMFEMGYDSLLKLKYERYNFNLLNQMGYEVQEGFPRILETDLIKGIGRVSYHITLSSCEEFSVDYKEVVNYDE